MTESFVFWFDIATLRAAFGNSPKIPKSRSGRNSIQTGGRGSKGKNPQGGSRGRGKKPTCFVAGTLVLTQNGAQSIESVTVGQRVITNENFAITSDITPDDSWRVLKVLFTDESDRDKIIDITLLRSFEWISKFYNVQNNSIWLEFEEMNLRGWGHVLFIERPERIEYGPGRLVTATFSSLHDDVYELYLDKLTEPLKPTEVHKFYQSKLRRWLDISNLQVNDRLASLKDDVQVLSVNRIPGEYRVYNIEVQGTHTYYVTTPNSSDWVFTHNRCGDGDQDDSNVRRGPRGGVSHTPGRGHNRKSAGKKKKKFQKKAAKKRKAKQKAYDDALKRWENMSDYAKKKRPELDPENFK